MPVDVEGKYIHWGMDLFRVIGETRIGANNCFVTKRLSQRADNLPDDDLDVAYLFPITTATYSLQRNDA